MDNEAYEKILDKLDEVNHKNISLSKQNKNLIKKNRHLKRIIKDYKYKLEKEKERNKPGNKHYKNGKRGTRFNG